MGQEHGLDTKLNFEVLKFELELRDGITEFEIFLNSEPIMRDLVVAWHILKSIVAIMVAIDRLKVLRATTVQSISKCQLNLDL